MKRLAAILALTSLTACSYFGSSTDGEQIVVTAAPPPVEIQFSAAVAQPEAAAVEPATAATTGTKSIAPMMPQSKIAIADAWAMTTPRGLKVAAGYFTVANNGIENDRLISVSTPRAARAEIRTVTQESGVAKLRLVPSVEVPTGGSATLREGGAQIMFIDVDTPFTEGETIPVMLTFEKAGKIEVTMRVKSGSKVIAGR